MALTGSWPFATMLDLKTNAMVSILVALQVDALIRRQLEGPANWPDAAVPTMTEPLFATRYGQPSTQRESGPVGVHTSASFFFLGMAAASLSARLPRWLGPCAMYRML